MHFVVYFYQTNKDFKPILPTEIVFLRTVAAANPAPLPGATDVFFDILGADDQFSFDVVKRSHQGMIMGKRKEFHLKPGSQSFNKTVKLHILYYISIPICVVPQVSYVR